MQLADTVAVVLVPEAGDAVQVMKAGLLEIADVFVVNKADRDGADRIEQELTQMLTMRPATPWIVPVIRTEARTGAGTKAVLDALERHRAATRRDGDGDESRRVSDVIDILDEEMHRRLRAGFAAPQDGMVPMLAELRAGTIDPYTAAVRILDDPTMLDRLVAGGPRG
jgi:LAO/AO transport system kinase